MQESLPVRERGSCCEVALDIKPAAVSAAVDLLRLLADPARLQMMAALQEAAQPVCICDFTAALGLSQPTISHHMGKLRHAGLVKVTRFGVWSFYEIAPSLAPAVKDLLASAVAAARPPPPRAGSSARQADQPRAVGAGEGTLVQIFSPSQASAMAAIDTRSPATSTGSLAPCLAGRVDREPRLPLLIHAREVLRVAQDEGGADDLVQRAPGRLQDRRQVLQALARLLLDGGADKLSGGRVDASLTGHKHQSRGLDRLAVPG